MAIKAQGQITLSSVVDVKATYRYYLLQSSTLTKPSAPTTYPPASTWGDVEPTYTEGSTNSLYVVDCTVFCDDTFQYSAVSLSSSYEAAKTAYNKAVNAQATAGTALDQSIEYIVGTQTAATNAWTGVTTSSSLYNGKTIAYKLPYAGTSSAATLNLTLSTGTKTGAKALRRANSSVTTQFPAGTVITLTYDGTYWRTTSINTDTYDRTRYSNAVKVLDAGTAYPYIMVGTASGYKIAKSGVAFDVSYPVLVYSSSTDLTAGGTTTYMYTQLPSATLRNNVASWTGTQYAMAYLVGTLSGKTFTINSTVFTTTTPTSADGLAYIPIGVLVDTYRVYFKSDPTVYAYGSNGFAPVSANAQASADAAQTTANTAVTNAATAQTAAENAQSTADSVQSDLSANYYTKIETDAQIKVESDAIRSEVSSTYADKTTVSTELEQLADQINMVFTKTSTLEDVDKSFNEQFDQFYDYIRFEGGAITLGGSENPIVLRVAKDGIEFMKNGKVFGSWDGEYFYTGNIYVRTSEQARFGDIAFVPRDDRSLSILWVGE